MSRTSKYRFGIFEVNLQARELRKHGVRVKLQGQPFEILSLLIEHPGEIVTREQLRERLWQTDTFVDFEHSLNTAVKKLRAALGDSPENSRYVETIPRVGYRFIAPVEAVPREKRETQPAVSEPQAPPSKRPMSKLAHRRWFIALGIAMALITALGGRLRWLHFLRQPLPLALVGGAAKASAAPFAYITDLAGGTVSVIDVATNKVTAIVSVQAYPEGVAVTPDGTRVYVANRFSNTVSVIDTDTKTVTVTVSGMSTPVGVAVTPDGTRVYVANFASSTVSVIDTASNRVTTTVLVPGGSPSGVAVTPDGTRVYVSDFFSSTVSVIHTGTNTVTATVSVQANPSGMAVTPNGTRVYVANEGSSNVSVIDTATNAVTATVAVNRGGIGVAVTPDGTRVYVANDVGTVSVIDTVTNTVTATVSVGSGPFGVAVTPDGAHVYVANRFSNTVSVIDTASNKVTTTVQLAAGGQPASYGTFISNTASTVSLRK